MNSNISYSIKVLLEYLTFNEKCDYRLEIKEDINKLKNFIKDNSCLEVGSKIMTRRSTKSNEIRLF